MNFISPYTFSRSFPFARNVRKNDTFSFGGFLGVVGGSLGVFGGCFVILGVFGGSELVWGIFGGSSHPASVSCSAKMGTITGNAVSQWRHDAKRSASPFQA